MAVQESKKPLCKSLISNGLGSVVGLWSGLGLPQQPKGIASTAAARRTLIVPDMQEFSEDMGSAARRLGTSLISSLTFSKVKSSKSFKDAAAAAVAGGAGSSGNANTESAEAAEEAAAATEQEAARHMPGASSAPALGGNTRGGGGLLAEGGAEADGASQPYTSLTFGTLGSRSMAAPGSSPAASPSHRSSSGGSACSSGTGAEGSSQTASGGGIARVAGGVAHPGSKTAQGRLDCVMQVRKRGAGALAAAL